MLQNDILKTPEPSTLVIWSKLLIILAKLDRKDKYMYSKSRLCFSCKKKSKFRL